MSKQPREHPLDIFSGAILAAGGIVRGQGENEGKILLVRRSRYRGEIGLPKGKVKRHEGIPEAALREVREETGYTVEIDEYAGRTKYAVGKSPKIVFYFVMRLASSSPPETVDTTEIETAFWTTPVEAVTQLSHNEDRALIASVFGLKRG